MGCNKSWSEWWRGFLGIGSDGYRKALEILCTRYLEENQHVARYRAQAAKLQYPQFRKKLSAIAADETKHVNLLAEKITSLGGRLPEVPPLSVDEKTSWQYLLEDLNENERCSAQLIADAQDLRDELPTVVELLEQIYQDESRYRDNLRDMLMRSDPQSH